MSSEIESTKSRQLMELAIKSVPVNSASTMAEPRVVAVDPQVDPKAYLATKQKVGNELESNYKQLEAAVNDIRKMADKNLLNLGFSIDRKINTHVVVVTDKSTGEVIRQIPNEVVIRVAHNIADLKGVLFDSKF